MFIIYKFWNYFKLNKGGAILKTFGRVDSGYLSGGSVIASNFYPTFDPAVCANKTGPGITNAEGWASITINLIKLFPFSWNSFTCTGKSSVEYTPGLINGGIRIDL